MCQILSECAYDWAGLKLRLNHMRSLHAIRSCLVLSKLQKLLHQDLVGLRCLDVLKASL